jgi:hypothetical protein
LAAKIEYSIEQQYRTKLTKYLARIQVLLVNGFRPEISVVSRLSRFKSSPNVHNGFIHFCIFHPLGGKEYQNLKV